MVKSIKKCTLQDLAVQLGIKRVSYEGPMSSNNQEIVTRTIRRNTSKCVLCTRCVGVCEHIQSIGAISASHRGFVMVVI